LWNGLPTTLRRYARDYTGPMHQVEAETVKKSSIHRYVSVRWWILEWVEALTKKSESYNFIRQKVTVCHV
jgi:hypothetical protein